MLKMLPPSEIMELILQSIEESDLFRSDWDKGFVKVVLELFLTKGDFSHFVEYYDGMVDRSEFEHYFKDTIIDIFDEDFYYEVENNFYGDDDGEL